jgi:hypothetical protein
MTSTELSTDPPEDATHRALKYKLNLLAAPPRPAADSYDVIQQFLDDEKLANRGGTWNKLSKSLKHKKIQDYARTYAASHELADDEAALVLAYLANKIHTGQLSKAKEVLYDKAAGAIRDIPGLAFDRPARHVTLKTTDARHVSTLKKYKTSLKHCPGV